MSVTSDLTTQPATRRRLARTETPASAKVPRRPLLTRRWAPWLGALLPLVLLALWQYLSTAGVFSAVQLPAPSKVVAAALDLAGRGQLGLHVAISTQRVVLGFSIGATLGLVLGAWVGLSRWAQVLAAPHHRRPTRCTVAGLGAAAAALDRHR